ncbi:unnamed protein product [Alternaria alternata]
MGSYSKGVSIEKGKRKEAGSASRVGAVNPLPGKVIHADIRIDGIEDYASRAPTSNQANRRHHRGRLNNPPAHVNNIDADTYAKPATGINESHPEKDSQDFEKSVPVHLEKKQPWRAGILKRSHSQSIEGDSSYIDNGQDHSDDAARTESYPAKDDALQYSATSTNERISASAYNFRREDLKYTISEDRTTNACKRRKEQFIALELPNTCNAKAIQPSSPSKDKPPVSRPSLRDSWQTQQPFHRGLSQTPQLTPLSSTPSGLPQPPSVNERIFSNHRAVFSQHNTPRQNPTPPPLAGFNNSPNPHSRTSSISGPPGPLPRHGIPSTTAAQHAQAMSASAQILQPNPYAQVDPPGSGVPPSGPMGMRPSPHLSTSHMAQQRDAPSRNDHSQASNANLSYSNPQTPNEHPAHPFQGLSRLTEPYRPRDPRDTHDFDPRHSDRDTSRELSQRTEYLREQLSNPALRVNGPPMHEDIRFQPQDRGYLSQRSQTPLSRSEHGQPPPLQHPPHSSLGVANQALYSQRPPEEPHRFMRDPRDRSMTDRIREEQAQAQHQAAINRDEHMRREAERDVREREMRESHAQDAHYRESIMRGRAEMRGPPPPQAPSSGPGSIHDPRPPAGPMDWVSGVRHPQGHPQDRGPWQQR